MTVVNRKKELVDNLIKGEIVKTVLLLIKNEQPVTMDEISRQCGVAKGTLYNHFKDKKALLNYVHQMIIAPIRDKNNTIFESSTDPFVKLHKFIDAAFEIHEDVSVYFRFLERERTAASQNDERFHLIMRQLIKCCKEGIEAGSFMEVAPFVLAEMIYGTVIGSLISMELSDIGTTHMEKIKQDVVSLVDRIILK